MATEHNLYLPTHPGLEGLNQLDKYQFSAANRSAHMAAFLDGLLFQKRTGAIIGGPFYYNANQWAVTTGGTGDAQAAATTEGGGLLITYASDDNFDTTLDDAIVVVGANLGGGEVISMRARIAVSDADGLGFKLGLTTGGSVAALPFGTNYTDVVAFSKPIASAAMVGTVRGNAQTAADTSTLATLTDGVEIDIGFYACIHATAPKGAWYVNGTFTPFSAAQLAQLVLILTTPPTNLYWTIHGTGVTGTNPTLLVKSWMTQVDI